MIKIQIHLGSKFYRILPIFLVVFLLFQHESIAQRNDYIVLRGTTFTEGDVKDLPSEGNTAVYFRRVSREEFTKYSIDEVGELMINQRKFFRKTIQNNEGTQTVYLELLPQELTSVRLWRLNQENEEFFIETGDEFIRLDDSYPATLEKLLANPELEPLISITSLNWYDLIYLFNTAKRYETPRTYTPMFVFTPYAGITFIKNQFTIPNSSYVASLNGSGSTIGFNAEAFLNFKRNISLNLSPSWSTFGLETLLNYEYGGFRAESDVFMDFSAIQLPLTAKYYIDLRPNKFRVFFEAGYVFAFNDYKKLGMYIAQKEGDAIITFQRDFSLDSQLNGYTYGVGVEKYFERAKGIVFGIKNTNLKAGSSEKVNSASAYAGFKF